ncbi:MAG TPA: ABC transporter permease [Bryobacteraceae bacterium]|nr:ABC transporter permease [Bryobacteraceae bacterium]
MGTFVTDWRHAFRVLRRAPAFTVTTVLILALAIGANTAMYSIVDAWLFRPLHFKDSNQVVIVLRGDLKHPGAVPIFDFYRDYLDWKPVARSFQSMSAMFWQGFAIIGSGEADHVMGMNVTADLFQTLGVAPQLGRGFTPSDLTGPPVVAVSHQFWQQHLSGARNVLGRTLTLNAKPCTVIAVLPAWFSLRMENQGFDPQILALMRPDDPDYARESVHPVAVIARLKRGVNRATAQAELFTLQMSLDARHPKVPKGFGVFLTRLQDDNARFIHSSLVTLLAAVGLVLLIACANVAGLLLGRAAHRQNEMALRAALGSGRARLARQLLTESLVLGLLGAAFGLLFAYAGIKGFTAANPFNQLPPDPIAIHPAALGVALALALVNTALFGAAPAWRASRVDLNTFLKSRGAGVGARAGLGRSALVAVEVALSLVLLTGTALVTKALVKLLDMPLGFRPEHVQVATLSLPADGSSSNPSRLAGFYSQVLQRIRGIPGVDSAALTNIGPLVGGQTTTLSVAGRPAAEAGESALFEHHVVTPQYFEVLSTPLLHGRLFTDRDTGDSLPVAIVNDAVARSVFPGADPVGQKIRLGDGPWRTIVGVAGTLRTIFYNTLVAREPLAIYVPAQQDATQNTWIFWKSAHPLTLREVRTQIDSIDKSVFVGDFRTMQRVVAEATGQPRQRTTLLAGFALLALILSAIGIYGLIAQNTAQRTSEIGIRMALGANPGDVLRMVIRQGISIASVGIALGIAGALSLGRVLSAYLYGVSPTDPATYAIVTALVLAVAALAAFLPARRASRVDPLVALRYE